MAYHLSMFLGLHGVTKYNACYCSISKDANQLIENSTGSENAPEISKTQVKNKDTGPRPRVK